VESLEERWLLSGLPAPADPAGEPLSPVADIAPTSLASVTSAAVEVVELEVATEADDGADVEIAPSNLPTAIVDALDARFPGAEVVEAEFSIEDGAPEYDVTAEWGDRLFGLTMTADGSIIEMEQALTTDELPQSVRDWVRENYPGAVIGEAGVVNEAGVESYELLIATPGQQTFEATLRVPGAAPRLSLESTDQVGSRFDSALPTVNATFGLSDSRTASDTVARETPLESGTPGDPDTDDTAKQAVATYALSYEQFQSQPEVAARTDEQTAQPGLDNSSVGDASQEANDTIATVASNIADQSTRATPVAEAMRALVAAVASATPTAWFPQVAGVLSDVLPIDLAAVERGLQQLLDEIDSLAEKVTGDTVATSSALRVAIVAGLITGAELIMIDSRKPKRELVLESNAANSSWSWVLGATTPKRP
jgi:hypothetical protein